MAFPEHGTYQMGKFQALNTKLQRSSKPQISMRGLRSGMSCLEFGFWDLFGAWSLGFGASQKVPHLRTRVSLNRTMTPPGQRGKESSFGIARYRRSTSKTISFRGNVSG